MASELNSDQAFTELHSRLFESGEWDRIMGILMKRLREKGWLDAVQGKSKEAARSLQSLTFANLMNTVEPEARDSVPDDVKREITSLLSEFLARNVV